MVVLSGAVANSSFRDLQGDFSGIFRPDAVEFINARRAETSALQREKLGTNNAIELQKMGQDAAARLQTQQLEAEANTQKRELDAEKRSIRFARLASLPPVVNQLANAFKPQVALGADLLEAYGEKALNRPDPLQVAEQTLARTNNIQKLIDGLGPNVVAPFMARGLNDYYSGIDPFSNSLPNPTQGFL